ncbi:ubiquitin-protein ligase E3C [Tetranychus urticae]|uniref:Ubiquitin-protein ligase E3C n=1 Tax=Tetranychus urticae TaxID=32264 RepID=T1K5B5_TETUR|nr:ubiquitin-protein ligase E3C [Tetranychus urticae]
MFSFEGNFKSKPEQRLGGASKKLTREQLIQKNAEERRQRETLRKQIHAVTKIQSVFRSYLIRKRLFNELRQQFDQEFNRLTNCQKNCNVFLTNTCQRLLLFYHPSSDGSRLLSLGQTFIKLKSLVIECLLQDPIQWSHRIRKLLFANIKQLCLSLKTDNNLSVAVPLRLIEVYTTLETYTPLGDVKKGQRMLTNIWTYLASNGYFHYLREIIDSKVPEPYEETIKAPTPIADSLFNLIVRPLDLDGSCSETVNSTIVLKFFSEFLSGPLSPQVKLHVIPKLIHQIPASLTPSSILSSIYPGRLPDSEDQVNGMHSLALKCDLWQLYNVVALVSPQLHLMSKSDKFRYLIILQVLCQYLPEQNIESPEDEDEDVEMTDPGENREYMIDQELIVVANQIIQLINEVPHVNCLISLVDTKSPNKILLIALSSVCHALLFFHKFALHQFRLLYTLAFKPSFLRHLWSYIIQISTPSIFDQPTPLLQLLARGLPLASVDWRTLLPQFTLFCALFSYLLPTLDDVEFYEEEDRHSLHRHSSMPFSLVELQKMTMILKDVCIRLIELAYHDTKLSVKEEYRQAMKSVRNEEIDDDKFVKQWLKLFKSTVNLLRHLYIRDSRRAFCPPNHWISRQISIPVEKPTIFKIGIRQRRRYQQFLGVRRLTKRELEEQGPPLSTSEIRNITILQEIPFVVPFHDRVKILQSLMAKDKENHIGERHRFMVPGSAIDIMIRRNFIYEDAFEKLSPENEPDLKKPIRVTLVNAVGLDEAGIDGGGIFREFLNELLKTCFDPNRGFFKATHERLLYPNPASEMLVENHQHHFYFIGRMLGKALYENMLVELPFSPFFLVKILVKHQTSDIDVHHLASLDPVMYKNLVYLKNYEGDVSELGLDFTVVNSDLGENQIIELRPGGANIQVTAQNRIEYIHLMADYRLNKQIRSQCSAFKQGLADVIDLDWIRMFDPRELQTLISGAQTPIDLEDLKAHVNYSGGYSPTHPTIEAFWQVVEEFDETKRRKLLKFVTSCSRPPLLGFKDLHPPFCIQCAGKEDRLPTASTCMNLLKLCEFADANILKQKLLYAIESGAGFELS